MNYWELLHLATFSTVTFLRQPFITSYYFLRVSNEGCDMGLVSVGFGLIWRSFTRIFVGLALISVWTLTFTCFYIDFCIF